MAVWLQVAVMVIISSIPAFASEKPEMYVQMLTKAHAEDATLITDDSEYAVFAAVLFPGEPEVPDSIRSDLEKRAYRDRRRIRLDGIHSNRYLVSRFTVTGSQSEKGLDQALIADYNTRNTQAFMIDEVKLRAVTPKRGDITLVSPPDISKRADGEQLRSGMTCLSRPGFNKDRTKAVLQINHVADYEMGVGYLVYLEKSSKSGAWVMTGAVLNRRY